MLGRRKAAGPDASWATAPAEIVDVEYGLVHNVNTGVGGSFERSSANKTVHLRVEPTGSAPYEATLKLGRDEPGVPFSRIAWSDSPSSAIRGR